MAMSAAIQLAHEREQLLSQIERLKNTVAEQDAEIQQLTRQVLLWHQRLAAALPVLDAAIRFVQGYEILDERGMIRVGRVEYEQLDSAVTAYREHAAQEEQSVFESIADKPTGIKS